MDWLISSVNSLFATSEFVSVQSTIDQQVYDVLPHTDALAAADALARLHANIELVLAQVKKELSVVDRLTAARVRLFDRIAQHGIRIRELDPDVYDSIAVNRNKSESILICLRSNPPDDNTMGGDDTLLFIAIHELAHSMIGDFASLINGHTVHNSEFRQCERYLMDIASSLGLLSPKTIPGRVHCSKIMPDPETAV